MEYTERKQEQNLCGAIIRQERRKMGLSEDAFASVILVTKDELSELENGVRKPDQSELVLIGHVLHANPAALAEGILSPPLSGTEIVKSLGNLQKQLDSILQESRIAMEELRQLIGQEEPFYEPEPQKEKAFSGKISL